MTLVFLHPIGLDGGCWKYLPSEILREGVHFDMLWHGGRGKPGEPLSMATFADDVAASCEGHLDIVGLSMGAAVAQHVALRYGARVRSLVLAASSAGGAAAGMLRERAATVERQGMPGVLETTLRRWFSPEGLKTEDSPAVRYAREALLRNSPEAFAASWRALAGHDTRRALHTLMVPTTVLHAADDAAISLESMKELNRMIPRSRLVVVGGPHMVQLERPEEFDAALLEHLNWVSAQGSHSS